MKHEVSDMQICTQSSAEKLISRKLFSLGNWSDACVAINISLIQRSCSDERKIAKLVDWKDSTREILLQKRNTQRYKLTSSTSNLHDHG